MRKERRRPRRILGTPGTPKRPSSGRGLPEPEVLPEHAEAAVPSKNDRCVKPGKAWTTSSAPGCSRKARQEKPVRSACLERHTFNMLYRVFNVLNILALAQSVKLHCYRSDVAWLEARTALVAAALQATHDTAEGAWRAGGGRRGSSGTSIPGSRREPHCPGHSRAAPHRLGQVAVPGRQTGAEHSFRNGP